MDTNFLHLTHYIRTIINCKYTTPVAIISHTINNISCLIFNIINIYVLDMFKTNQPKVKKMNNEKDVLKLKKEITEKYGISSERFNEVMNTDFEEIDPDDENFN